MRRKPPVLSGSSSLHSARRGRRRSSALMAPSRRARVATTCGQVMINRERDRRHYAPNDNASVGLLLWRRQNNGETSQHEALREIGQTYHGKEPRMSSVFGVLRLNNCRWLRRKLRSLQSRSRRREQRQGRGKNAAFRAVISLVFPVWDGRRERRRCKDGANGEWWGRGESQGLEAVEAVSRV